MHTKDMLAAALREPNIDGLNEMAVKAEQGYYHDFLSPLAFPEMQLEADLRAVREKQIMGGPQWRTVEALRQRHLNGDFDANHEESEEWMKSDEGQEALIRLGRGK